MKYIIFAFSLLLTVSVSAQDKQYKVAAVGFYNFENLFDTLDTENVKDEEFTPDGGKGWNPEKYNEKLGNLAHVITQLGTEKAKTGVSVLGCSEIENRQVLEDLIAHPMMADKNFGIVHYDSQDARGIDVGLLYRKDHFTVTNSAKYFVDIASVKLEKEEAKEAKKKKKRRCKKKKKQAEEEVVEMTEEEKAEEKYYTRDILLVSGLLDGEEMHFLVNHWPSRRGGEKRSSPLREKAGSVARHIVDSLYTVDPDAKIMVMGDLNDNPTNRSLTRALGASQTKDAVGNQGLFNPMAPMFREGFGSNAYRDSWSLFDQIVVSEPLLTDNDGGYKYFKAVIYNKKFLVQPIGQFKGYPFRTFVGNAYQGGYSDHFPVFVYLTKEVE